MTLFVLVAVLAGGCALGYVGRQVSRQPVTWIGDRDSGRDALVFRDITVKYGFARRPGAIELEGVITANQNLQGLSVLRQLYVDALVVDENGVVIDSQFVSATMLAQDIQRPISFRATAPFPSGAAGLTFRYRGTARSPGDSTGDGYQFFN